MGCEETMSVKSVLHELIDKVDELRHFDALELHQKVDEPDVPPNVPDAEKETPDA
jgi:hypothetical protein